MQAQSIVASSNIQAQDIRSMAIVHGIDFIASSNIYTNNLTATLGVHSMAITAASNIHGMNILATSNIYTQNIVASSNIETQSIFASSNLKVQGNVMIGAASLSVTSAPMSTTLTLTGVTSFACDTSTLIVKEMKAVSDRRLKKNIKRNVRRDERNDLQKLMNVAVHDFMFRGRSSPKKGFIAQQLEVHYPEAVSKITRRMDVTCLHEANGLFRVVIPGEMDIEIDDKAEIERGYYIVNSISTDARSNETLISLDNHPHIGDKLNGIEHELDNHTEHARNIERYIKVTIIKQLKVVDYEYLVTVMLNALKCIARTTNRRRTVKNVIRYTKR